MLDGVDAGLDGEFGRRVAVAVRRRLASPGVGLLHDGVHLRLRQLRVVHRIAQGEHAARGHELDDGGAVLDLPAHRLAALVGAVADAALDALGGHAVGRKRIGVRVTAARADGVEGKDHPRPGHGAALDGVVQAEVDELGGAQVADGGEARVERAPGVLGGVLRLLGGPAQEDVHLVAVPALPRLEGDVRVRVDEAGQKRGVAEVDDLRARRRRAAHLRDALVLHHHQAGPHQGALARIEEAGGLEDHGLREQDQREQEHETSGRRAYHRARRLLKLAALRGSMRP